MVLIDGRVHAVGPKREVFQHPPDRETAELLGHTIVETESDGVLAFPPGALRSGAGPREFTMLVKRVVNLGSHDHAIGEILGRGGFTRADVRLPEGAAPPEPGSHMVVSVQYWSSLPPTAELRCSYSGSCQESHANPRDDPWRVRMTQCPATWAAGHCV